MQLPWKLNLDSLILLDNDDDVMGAKIIEDCVERYPANFAYRLKGVERQ